MIDIPVSNCLHSGIDKIAILTQYNSVSLHRHIYRTYRRDMFTDGWVQVLAAEQTPSSKGWYQGTADAVRQQLVEINSSGTKYVIILAGDHLYRMNYRKFVQYHVDTKANITLAVQPVDAQEAPALGILKRNSDGEIISFTEKPAPEILGELESTTGSSKPFMASMGIYVFSTELLSELLTAPGDDFGNDIIPIALSEHRVMGHVFDGYWADIGTIRRFYEVSLELIATKAFDLNVPNQPVYTNARFLPPTELQGARISKVMLAEGCKIGDAEITNSLVGIRSIIGSQVVMRDTVMMGADYYETEEQRAENRQLGRPDIGVGDSTVIESAIIDKKARIGRNVQIRFKPDRPDSDNDNWLVRDGLVVVPKSAVISDDTVI